MDRLLSAFLADASFAIHVPRFDRRGPAGATGVSATAGLPPLAPDTRLQAYYDEPLGFQLVITPSHAATATPIAPETLVRLVRDGLDIKVAGRTVRVTRTAQAARSTAAAAPAHHDLGRRAVTLKPRTSSRAAASGHGVPGKAGRDLREAAAWNGSMLAAASSTASGLGRPMGGSPAVGGLAMHDASARPRSSTLTADRKRSIGAGAGSPSPLHPSGKMLHRRGTSIRMASSPLLAGIPDPPASPAMSASVSIHGGLAALGSFAPSSGPTALAPPTMPRLGRRVSNAPFAASAITATTTPGGMSGGSGASRTLSLTASPYADGPGSEGGTREAETVAPAAVVMEDPELPFFQYTLSPADLRRLPILIERMGDDHLVHMVVDDGCTPAPSRPNARPILRLRIPLSLPLVNERPIPRWLAISVDVSQSEDRLDLDVAQLSRSDSGLVNASDPIAVGMAEISGGGGGGGGRSLPTPTPPSLATTLGWDRELGDEGMMDMTSELGVYDSPQFPRIPELDDVMGASSSSGSGGGGGAPMTRRRGHPCGVSLRAFPPVHTEHCMPLHPLLGLSCQWSKLSADTGIFSLALHRAPLMMGRDAAAGGGSDDDLAHDGGGGGGSGSDDDGDDPDSRRIGFEGFPARLVPALRDEYIQTAIVVKRLDVTIHNTVCSKIPNSSAEDAAGDGGSNDDDDDDDAPVVLGPTVLPPAVVAQALPASGRRRGRHGRNRRPRPAPHITHELHALYHVRLLIPPDMTMEHPTLTAPSRATSMASLDPTEGSDSELTSHALATPSGVHRASLGGGHGTIAGTASASGATGGPGISAYRQYRSTPLTTSSVVKIVVAYDLVTAGGVQPMTSMWSCRIDLLEPKRFPNVRSVATRLDAQRLPPSIPTHAVQRVRGSGAGGGDGGAASWSSMGSLLDESSGSRASLAMHHANATTTTTTTAATAPLTHALGPPGIDALMVTFTLDAPSSALNQVFSVRMIVTNLSSTAQRLEVDVVAPTGAAKPEPGTWPTHVLASPAAAGPPLPPSMPGGGAAWPWETAAGSRADLVSMYEPERVTLGRLACLTAQQRGLVPLDTHHVLLCPPQGCASTQMHFVALEGDLHSLPPLRITNLETQRSVVVQEALKIYIRSS
ncbi:hypothetical protein CXG81DRAFT_26735 [Caulochytrium protostelioides]|uniref:TRAPP trafficking subunit Trs65-domain-containing protein n=1 Tax=Caulochytrium protostelioides TaxID=1555241 RepID=A0A4P9X5Y9_9FUNG|nr:hypothetical protein CXG81DRAFT_26735 [Caulochytrium protostelioides]|eukprot:RKP00552.1 hypothetical protein CXG81DRAFT_26735 [Caulochytrium protostelioides]